MRIRAEEPADRDVIQSVHRRAFGEHGSVVAPLVDALRDADPAALSLVAVDGDGVVGHVMFTRGLLDAPQRLVDVAVLSPVGVLPERRRQGVGGALIRRGLELVDAPFVFLEGDPAYYRRFGFVPGGPRGFRKPSLRIPDEAFQVLERPGSEPWMSGTLVYSHVFWDFDAVGLRD
jgi:putative acetyltransferase